ncbi:vitamin D3 hydroxylase-associated protein-like [Ambystoma mexicanum]|uniref:vitamin D3 hydroxylase-associated protein-like n=1 Tax=Ambystoma mexicanum TaxID=8296 RepID=UPI0037E8E0F2
MIAENVREMVPEVLREPGLLTALVLCSGVSLAAMVFLKQWKLQRKTAQAKKRRDYALTQMEEAVLRFKRQNPRLNSGPILTLTLVELSRSLQDGSLTPDDVLYAYIEKAFELNKELNCLTDFLQECESQLQDLKTINQRGPLYGVPVSIKQSIYCQGYDSSCGLLQLHGVLDQQDSVLIQVLKKQGAIPFVKTNIPQSLISFESSNPIYGLTRNPLNQKKSPAGSSGGEGALIGGGGSIIGIGTDMGGSVRVPASFCGICALKPTAFRISAMGTSAPIDGQTGVATVMGPMGRNVEDLALCMRALLCEDMFRLDPTVPPIPFNDEVYSSSGRLRIGYYDTDDYFPATPSMRRVVRETKDLLEEAGHTLIAFSLPPMDRSISELFIQLFFADGASTFVRKFEGNLIDPNLHPVVSTCKLPVFIKRMLGVLLKPWSPRIASFYTAMCKASSVEDLWKHQKKQQDYCHAFISEWNRLELDVILCPVVGPAFNIGMSAHLLASGCYTMQYNILNFPAGVVPVSTVTEEDERQMKNYTERQNDMWDRAMRKAVEGGVGLPLSVQCVALPWQEELCLRFMKEVETLTASKKRT